MAHQLTAQGEEVPILVLIEYFPPGSRLPRTSLRYISIGIKRFYKDLNKNQTYLAKVKFINHQLRRFRKFLSRKAIQKTNSATIYTQAPPRPYYGKVALFTAQERFFGYERAEIEWAKRFQGELETFIVEGDHLGIFYKKGPAQMAEKLNSIMASVNEMYQLKQATSVSA
jgi:thioesterase domain-containing protein